MRLSCLAGAGGPASVLCGITQLPGRSPADSSLSGAPVSEELRHILAGMDTTRVRRLQRWFEDQAVALRVIAEASEADQARSAELAGRLAAWRATLAPSRLKRDAKVLRWWRRGFTPDQIAAAERAWRSEEHTSELH